VNLNRRRVLATEQVLEDRAFYVGGDGRYGRIAERELRAAGVLAGEADAAFRSESVGTAWQATLQPPRADSQGVVLAVSSVLNSAPHGRSPVGQLPVPLGSLMPLALGTILRSAVQWWKRRTTCGWTSVMIPTTFFLTRRVWRIIRCRDLLLDSYSTTRIVHDVRHHECPLIMVE
jgi:hypothetical protein